jgi:bifunctional DNase/RNase
MDLSRIIISERSEQQIIVLQERSGARQFPIVIGSTEAMAIDRRVKGVQTQRPLTHELMASVIKAMHGEVEKIVIHDLREHTFYAKLVIRLDGELLEVDARPSDAIALGAAGETPIYVDERVLREVTEMPGLL